MSAPQTSADFLFQEDSMSSAGETVDEHRLQPFAREENGLVDLEDYRPYLIDPPQIVPTRPPLRDTARRRFVHQHIYFTETRYKQSDIPIEKRDKRLVALRNSPYSQIIMRSYLENRMHHEKESSVEPPPNETIDDTLQDYFQIDLVGATTLALREIMTPRQISAWEQKKYIPPPEVQALSRRDRIKILLTEREKAFTAISSPRILPSMVVASAAKRLAIHLEDHTLEGISGEHLDGEEDYYPLAVPKKGYLRDVGGMVLNCAVGIRSLEDSRIIAQGLQTEVDGVELAA